METAETSKTWRRSLYLLLVSNCLSMLGLNFALPFMSLYIHDLGIKDPGEAAFWSGVALGAGGISLFIFGPIWGSIGDWIGRKSMVVRASVGGGLSVAVLVFAPSVPWVVFIRSFEGIFSGNTGAGQAMVASIAPRDRLTQSMGLLQMATFTGMALGPLIGGTLVDLFGFKITFFVVGSLMMLGGIFVWRFIKEDHTSSSSGAIPSPLKLVANLVDVLRSSQASKTLGFFLLLQVSAAIVNPVLPLFLKTLSREDAAVGSLLGTALFMMGVTGAATAALLARFSHRFGLKPIIVFACLGFCAVDLAQLFTRSVLQFTMLVAISGVFRASMLTASVSLIGLTVPRTRVGSAFGIAQSLGAASLAIAPLVGGTLASLFGLRLVFAFAATSFLLLALVAAIGLDDARTEAQATSSKP